MNAALLVARLLEMEDADYVGDPKTYALDTGSAETWKVPPGHSWVHDLRALGFKLKHNSYTPHSGEHEGKTIEYWSADKMVEMASGQTLHLIVSAYDQPHLLGFNGLTINYRQPHQREQDASGIYGSRPIKGEELVSVMSDIVRRLEATSVEYETNSYTRGVAETVNALLKDYEYWENER